MSIALIVIGVLIVSLIVSLLIGPMLRSNEAQREEDEVRRARDGFGWPKL